MTPEERKAIAMRQPGESATCQRFYPGCCSYHEGFDDALRLLGLRGQRPGGNPLRLESLYAIEPPEKESQNSDWWDDREANRAPLDAIEPPEATP